MGSESLRRKRVAQWVFLKNGGQAKKPQLASYSNTQKDIRTEHPTCLTGNDLASTVSQMSLRPIFCRVIIIIRFFPCLYLQDHFIGTIHAVMTVLITFASLAQIGEMRTPPSGLVVIVIMPSHHLSLPIPRPAYASTYLRRRYVLSTPTPPALYPKCD